MPENGSAGTPARVLILHPLTARAETVLEVALAEAAGLARALALRIVAVEPLTLRRARPATLFGRGQVDEIARRVQAEDIELVIVDAPLSPVQQRNLERAWACKAIDRTALILDIFAERARTREGRLQVELAQLTYQRSRLVRSWTHLERQRGGLGAVGGPGEAQIETDRRLIDDRIALLRRQLGTVTRTRALHRKQRRRAPHPVIALVGYTNAGKSSLFNRLTAADVNARDMLFATLDPTMRGRDLPSGQRIILSDTVGFISALPTQLIAAFRATLEEVLEAAVILHVWDASSPDGERQRQEVLRILADMGIDCGPEGPLLEVANKIDRLAPDDPAIGAAPLSISARTGAGLERLLAAIDARFAGMRRRLTLCLAPSDGAALAWLHARGRVLTQRQDDLTLHVEVELPTQDAMRFQRRFPHLRAQSGTTLETIAESTL